jgi:hypothetical protein
LASITVIEAAAGAWWNKDTDQTANWQRWWFEGIVCRIFCTVILNQIKKFQQGLLASITIQ